MDVATYAAALRATLANMTDSARILLPNLLGAAALILGGWLIAWLLQRLSTRVARRFDALARRTQVDGALQRMGVERPLSDVVGAFVFWTVFLFFIAGATEAFGLPALRLEGVYLALATFALAIAIPQMLKASFLEHWIGGVQGITIIKPDAPFGLPLNSDQWLYIFTILVAAVMYACAYSMVNSRTGRALIAIRDHPIAASAMGINVSLYKSLTFGVSALYTGVAGALGAIAISFVAPDSFTFQLAIALFVGLLLWLGLMLRGLAPALRRRDEARPLVLMFTGASAAIGLMYAAGFFFGARTHLSVMEYWRWWVVHLWVEGFFEVFATAALAFVFARMGLVNKSHAGAAVIASMR